jgi:hypothetical protein
MGTPIDRSNEKGFQLKLKWFLCAVVGAIALLAIQAAPVRADNVWGLSVGLQTPVGSAPQHYSENTPQLVWNGWLKTGYGALKLTSAGSYSLRDSNPFWSESKANLGLEYPLTPLVSVYGFVEDRYQLSQIRYVIGCKLSFGG